MDRNTTIGLAAAFFVLLFLFLDKKETKTAEVSPQSGDKQQFVANYGTPLLDGKADDPAWQNAEWQPIDQLWLGAPPSPNDF